MTWRRSTSQQDRILACLCYLIPLLEALPFGAFFLFSFPGLQVLFSPLLFLARIYFFSLPGLGLQIVALAVFIGLYVGVVRNDSLHHFLRFNAMQALLLAIVVYLVRLLLDLLGIVNTLNPLQGSDLLSPVVVLQNALFLAIYAASIYSIAWSARGLYAEMPIVSEAAYTQTRY